jgi:hypothetical protein
LTPYAGKRILVRFAMQNDIAVNHFGFAVDDISIPEINWSDNFEADDSKWIAKGFVRIQNRIPQLWGVRAVEQVDDNQIIVHDLTVADGTAKLDVDFSKMQRLVVFVVGQTRYTTIPANYELKMEK